ncbi:MAG: SCO family protein [Mycobacterium sp.]|nr:SCO family protein [Mycobacterium sp.]
MGLIGTNIELADAQAAFHIIVERRDVGDGDYLLDHTAAIYLVTVTARSNWRTRVAQTRISRRGPSAADQLSASCVRQYSACP